MGSIAFTPQALNMSATTALPLLLPTQPAKTTNSLAWEPQLHRQPPQPPVVDDQRIHDLELAVQRQLLDGKALKKTRPRRTVDYAGGMGRWALVCPCLILYLEFSLTRLFVACSFASCNLAHDTCHISAQALHTLSTYVQPAHEYTWTCSPNVSPLWQLLPPKAYPDNASTSLCTKFIHTSTNKIRCPVNAVTVRHFV